MLLRILKSALIGVCVLARRVGGHGYLADPPARNVVHNSDYCPHCLNAGGASAVWSGGKLRYGMCGDPWKGPKHHENGGKYGTTPPKKVRVFRRGQTFTARVVLTANHEGRWSLRVCPRSRRLSPGCFTKLRRADGKGVYTYVPDSASTFNVRYVLPRGLRCERCVLQWVYETSNSCTPRGMRGHLSTCSAQHPGEVFVNCADIRVR